MSIKTWAKWSVALASVVAFQACGGGSDDICGRLKDLSSKTGSCFASDSSDTADTSDTTSCEAALANCTDADKKAYDTFLDCAEKVGDCKTGAEQEWAIKVASCAQELNVSAACGDSNTTAQ